LMLGIEINEPDKRDALTNSLLKNGVIIDWFLFHPCTFRIAPPLTITLKESRFACELILKCMNDA
jgi:4-aminobutyrate aminotransferase-like enzyme